MKVLVAEDEPVLRCALESLLTDWGYEVVMTRDGNEACRLLCGAGDCDMAVLDWLMPGMDGLQVCREVRRSSLKQYVYLLLLTVKDQREDIVEGLEAGADDYLIKPFDAHELRARLKAGQRIIDLQTELIAAREALRHQATHDALTGLWNRAAIRDMLKRELARSQRERQPVGVALADIDHFKQINDAYGHLSGDAVLQQTAWRLGESLRPYDAVGRYGGEEFLVLLPGCGLEDAANLGERLRQSVCSTPVNLHGMSVPVTISLGITAGLGTDPEDFALLVDAADRALYRSTRNGRNRVEVVATGDETLS
jgi:diguanylate cyclase (GGDEF)-like protein